MTAKTKIQWTDFSWNPWHGCKKVSEGCKFCYMYRDKEQYGQEPSKVIKASKNTFQKPLHIKDNSLVFTCSWSDFFIEEADEWRDEAWNIIRKTPHLTYQILTKRPNNILPRLPNDFDKFNNVWLGVSVENDEYAYRVVYLEAIKKQFPNIKIFASFEPLIGEVNGHDCFQYLDWIIIGGESGNETGKYRYRKCELAWVENIIKAHKGKPIFVKQLGTYLSKQLKLKDRHGGNIDEFPDWLKIREMPK